MTIVVCDTSPICYLLLIGQIDSLPQLYGQVSQKPGFFFALPSPFSLIVGLRFHCGESLR